MDLDTLDNILFYLKSRGCYPALSRRGKNIWRFHINGAGNYWDEGTTPLIAAKKALLLWEKAGRPIDGYGVLADSMNERGNQNG